MLQLMSASPVLRESLASWLSNAAAGCTTSMRTAPMGRNSKKHRVDTALVDGVRGNAWTRQQGIRESMFGATTDAAQMANNYSDSVA
mmetsp:Transcript_77294/g.214876  ORF Transcript_77294/g.214876 Transcript_77294/m.214876 type:complete len:87 (-) Transcript_77294:10-270(-)